MAFFKWYSRLSYGLHMHTHMCTTTQTALDLVFEKSRILYCYFDGIRCVWGSMAMDNFINTLYSIVRTVVASEVSDCSLEYNLRTSAHGWSELRKEIRSHRPEAALPGNSSDANIPGPSFSPVKSATLQVRPAYLCHLKSSWWLCHTKVWKTLS